MKVSVAVPKGHEPHQDALDFAKAYANNFELVSDPSQAASKADILVTDIWASMGQEEEAEARQKAFAGFQINNELLSIAAAGAMVQHCLPAHRDEEIAADVLEAHANEIFDEAENRLHVQKAVMALLIGAK